jgi:hypothetical protein
MLSEFRQEGLWKNWLSAEIRSEYFADMCTRYAAGPALAKVPLIHSLPLRKSAPNKLPLGSYNLANLHLTRLPLGAYNLE